jgi:hypothetical protein
VDECTVNKVRLDYARLFLTTSQFSEINGVQKLYVDGVPFSVRLVEDLEFGLAEDACLVEYEADNASHCSEPVCMQDDVPLVDTLVDQLQAEWSKGSKPESVKSHYSVKNAVKQLEEAYGAAGGHVRNKDGLVEVEAEGAPDRHGSPPGGQANMSQALWSYNVCKKKGLVVGESAVPKVLIKEGNRQKNSHDGNKKLKGSRCDPSLLNLKRIARLPVKDGNKLIRAIK